MSFAHEVRRVTLRLVDIQNILAIQGLVDRPYLLDWARRLGVSEPLRRAIDFAEIPYEDDSSPSV